MLRVLIVGMFLGFLLPGRSLADGSSPGEPETVIYDRTGKVELARYSPGDLSEATWKAPHFIRRVRSELATTLCGVEEPRRCPQVDAGGFRIVSTLHWGMQQTAEKLLAAAAIAPHRDDMAAYLKELGVPNRRWLWNLRPFEVYNGALAAMDYRTGQIFAYAGSADPHNIETGDPRFQPAFDVLLNGWRQPGSAFKPFVYLPGIVSGKMTAATIFMDVATEVENGYWPKDADDLERGPVRLDEALRFSINIPAVKAAARNGVQAIQKLAGRFGIRFLPHAPDPGLAIGLGAVEVRPIEMLAAYGTLANGGIRVPQRTLITVTDADGKEISLRTSKEKEIIPPQAAFIMTSMLASTVDSKNNPYWGKFTIKKDGVRRPVAMKTGTSNESKDVSAYGFVAPPSSENARYPALVVGVWMGNNDNSSMGDTGSLMTAAPLWHNFLQAVSKEWPIAKFVPPAGVVRAKIDAFSGMAPGPFTRKIVSEWFVEGTEPNPDNTKKKVRVETASGKLWREGCEGTPEERVFLDPSKIEKGERPGWKRDNDAWVARARKGPGILGGPLEAQTSFFFNEDFRPYGPSWGAPLLPDESCDNTVLVKKKEAPPLKAGVAAR